MSGTMRNEVDVADLWRFYDEHAAQARQHETLRASVTSTLSGVAAAVVGLAAVGGIEQADWLAGFTVLLVGALGSALSIKHYERNRFHTKVLGVVRGEIDAIRQDPARKPQLTRELRRRATKAHRADFAIFRPRNGESQPSDENRNGATEEPSGRAPSRWISVRLHLLWLGLPAAIALVGVLVMVLALSV